jgi:hypothetical protein
MTDRWVNGQLGRRHQLGEIVGAFRQFYFREVLIIDISRPCTITES